MHTLAYVYSPNAATVIECLPSCTSADNPPRYAPAIYRDLVPEFYSANSFHQRGHQGNRPQTT